MKPSNKYSIFCSLLGIFLFIGGAVAANWSYYQDQYFEGNTEEADSLSDAGGVMATPDPWVRVSFAYLKWNAESGKDYFDLIQGHYNTQKNASPRPYVKCEFGYGDFCSVRDENLVDGGDYYTATDDYFDTSFQCGLVGTNPNKCVVVQNFTSNLGLQDTTQNQWCIYLSLIQGQTIIAADMVWLTKPTAKSVDANNWTASDNDGTEQMNYFSQRFEVPESSPAPEVKIGETRIRPNGALWTNWITNFNFHTSTAQIGISTNGYKTNADRHPVEHESRIRETDSADVTDTGDDLTWQAGCVGP